MGSYHSSLSSCTVKLLLYSWILIYFLIITKMDHFPWHSCPGSTFHPLTVRGKWKGRPPCSPLPFFFLSIVLPNQYRPIEKFSSPSYTIFLRTQPLFSFLSTSSPDISLSFSHPPPIPLILFTYWSQGSSTCQFLKNFYFYSSEVVHKFSYNYFPIISQMFQRSQFYNPIFHHPLTESALWLHCICQSPDPGLKSIIHFWLCILPYPKRPQGNSPWFFCHPMMSIQANLNLEEDHSIRFLYSYSLWLRIAREDIQERW